jgi:dihydropteroate synthase type 2
VSAAVGLLGIVNITEDSFSDGGRYLAPEAAIEHARALAADGADILDLGAASSNPDARPVPSDTEIARLAPVVAALKQDGRRVSVDSYSPEVQRWALAQGVDYLNDIQGFSSPEIYPELAESSVRLIVMHSVQREGRASRISVPPEDIFEFILRFFEERLRALASGGIAEDRLILDPGMGFFLGSNPDASIAVLRRLNGLKAAFGLPVLVSVSRKSFLRAITGRAPADSGPASLAAELFAVRQGADYIRTHEPGALKDALAVSGLLDGPGPAA